MRYWALVLVVMIVCVLLAAAITPDAAPYGSFAGR